MNASAYASMHKARVAIVVGSCGGGGRGVAGPRGGSGPDPEDRGAVRAGLRARRRVHGGAKTPARTSVRPPARKRRRPGPRARPAGVGVCRHYAFGRPRGSFGRASRSFARGNYAFDDGRTRSREGWNRGCAGRSAGRVIGGQCPRARTLRGPGVRDCGRCGAGAGGCYPKGAERPGCSPKWLSFRGSAATEESLEPAGVPADNLTPGWRGSADCAGRRGIGPLAGKEGRGGRTRLPPPAPPRLPAARAWPDPAGWVSNTAGASTER